MRIPPLVAAGCRCIAPDLMGFGLSDKPTKESDYTLRRRVKLITGLVEKLNLESVTVVGQDWGGPISLCYAIGHQSNIKTLVILNTLVTIMPILLFFKLIFQSGGFSSFLSKQVDLFRKMSFGGKLMIKRPSDASAEKQYIKDIEDTIRLWDIPVLVMFSDKDLAFNKVAEGQRIAEMAPNGRFQVIENAAYYLQKDTAAEIADRMATFFRDEAKVS